jgi:hypothetical protein
MDRVSFLVESLQATRGPMLVHAARIQSRGPAEFDPAVTGQ